MTRRRALGWTLAAFAALAQLLWLLLRSSDEEGAARDGARAASAMDAAESAPVKAKRRKLADAALAANDVETASSDASSGDDDEPDGSPLFPPLHVEVRLRDGTWPVGATGLAYLLLPGDSGAAGALVRADLEGDGTCTLRPPEPGLYDVGAVGCGEFMWTLAQDVDTRRVDRVRLTMPQAEVLRFVLDGPGGDGKQNVAAADGQVVAVTPGRGAVPSASPSLSLRDLPASWWVAPGMRFQFDRGVDPFFATPETFNAPATVTVSRPKWGLYRLTVGIDPPDLVAAADSAVDCAFELAGGGRVDRWGSLRGRWLVKAGQRVADALAWNFCQAPPAQHATLRWHGANVRSGSLEFDVPDEGSIDVRAVLRITDLPPVAPDPETRLCVEGAAARACYVVLDRNGDPVRGEFDRTGGDVAERVAADDGPHVALAFGVGEGPDVRIFASDPVVVEADRRHVLRLRPAGWLRVARGVRPPDDVEIRLRRRDGQPIPFVDGWTSFGSGPKLRAPDTEPAIALDRPAVHLGPFPEGDVALVASYAGRDLAEVTAHVVAGEITEIRLPLAERLPAR